MLRDEKECQLCSFANEPESIAARVEESDCWIAGPHPAIAVAGALFMQTRTHRHALTDLTESELQTLGSTMASIQRAMTSGYRAEKVYVAAFGEKFSHFHFLLIPRLADHEGARGPALIQQCLDPSTPRDPVKIAEAARKIRTSLRDE